jgi:hypothetical protein
MGLGSEFLNPILRAVSPPAFRKLVISVNGVARFSRATLQNWHLSFARVFAFAFDINRYAYSHAAHLSQVPRSRRKLRHLNFLIDHKNI